ncbi:L-threo-3-hydroxyaspartate ammonia-lyase [Seminavis robusta]|uniref:L-threo-3-hydroxyaspartate ammonia-lyase n=1 Tax=Seminavis robusta TaxID=568900 RepID=A0A9N8DXR8_9STRA|nr:L-threo-3-hydroxyaspartate ammonia-lyase [Seminavis robusta]|eukprot:Sro429_g140970.1 L-threo-3-hydroxyaspartate ammonia-lyase (792) ;mRNA; f:4810-7185
MAATTKLVVLLAWIAPSAVCGFFNLHRTKRFHPLKSTAANADIVPDSKVVGVEPTDTSRLNWHPPPVAFDHHFNGPDNDHFSQPYSFFQYGNTSKGAPRLRKDSQSALDASASVEWQPLSLAFLPDENANRYSLPPQTEQASQFDYQGVLTGSEHDESNKEDPAMKEKENPNKSMDWNQPPPPFLNQINDYQLPPRSASEGGQVTVGDDDTKPSEGIIEQSDASSMKWHPPPDAFPNQINTFQLPPTVKPPQTFFEYGGITETGKRKDQKTVSAPIFDNDAASMEWYEPPGAFPNKINTFQLPPTVKPPSTLFEYGGIMTGNSKDVVGSNAMVFQNDTASMEWHEPPGAFPNKINTFQLPPTVKPPPTLFEYGGIMTSDTEKGQADTDTTSEMVENDSASMEWHPPPAAFANQIDNTYQLPPTVKPPLTLFPYGGITTRTRTTLFATSVDNTNAASTTTSAPPLDLPTFDDVVEASEILEGIAHETPVETSRTLDDELGVSAFFKCENKQRMGAFKFRGGYNALSHLSAKQRDAGVLTFSSGNHAQAIALSSKILGCKSTVIMPEDAPKLKVAATKGYGATVISYDRYKEDREALARDLQEKEGAVFVPPYDDKYVIAGQGTSAKELIETLKTEKNIELDYLLVCVGGGGLISGSALSAKALSPNCKVIGIEPEAGNDAQQSMEKGEIVKIPTPPTIADGAQTQYIGKLTFEIMKDKVDHIITVSDEELVEGMKFFGECMKMIVEPTGCLGLAGLRKLVANGTIAKGSKCGVIISGGNVDLSRYSDLVSPR